MNLRTTYIAVILLLMSASILAQTPSYGVRLRVGSPALTFAQPTSLESEIQFPDISPEISVGGFMRIFIEKFYLQPELLVSKTSYEFEYRPRHAESAREIEEDIVYLDMPVLFGVSLGHYHIQVGPVYRIQLNQDSDWERETPLTRNFRDASMHISIGGGVDLGRFVWDISYQIPVQGSGDWIQLGGEAFSFSQEKKQLQTSIGFFF